MRVEDALASDESSLVSTSSSSFFGSNAKVVDYWVEEINQVVVNISSDFDEPSKILPDLFLGGKDSATDLKLLHSQGITHILNCGGSHVHLHHKKVPPEYHFEHKDIEAEDRPDFPLLDRFYEECRDFVVKARESNGKIFVHCKGGVNRSATMVIALCIDLEGWDLMRAIRHVFRRRPIILTNTGFQRQLVLFAWNRSLLIPRSEAQS